MKLDHVLVIFIVACGAVAGGTLLAAPEIGKFGVPPFLWLLLAMLAFEGFAHWRFGGTPGSLISMEFRMIALFAGVAVMFAIPYFGGVQINLL